MPHNQTSNSDLVKHPLDDDPLATKIQWFEDSEHETLTARELSERDRDYYDTRQLTSEEIAELESRGQPVVQFNRLRGKIDTMLGAEILGRTNPAAYPRTPKDEDAAFAITDSLNYVIDNESFDIKRTSVAKNMFIEGIGIGEVIVTPKSNAEPEITINQIPWDRFFYDPHSRDIFFRDARYMGQVIWADFDQAVLLADNPAEAAQVLEDAFMRSRTANSETYDDKPLGNTWIDSKRRRVRVIQMNYWRKEGWAMCTFTGAGFLKGPQFSPYLDEDGVPENPMIAVSAYIDRDNQRSGVLRPMISAQDEINKRRSKGLHAINTRQIIVEKGAVQDPRHTRKELAKPDGYVEVNPGAIDKIRIEENQDMSVGNLTLLQEAKSEIDVVAPNSALQGTGSQDQSGRSQQIQAQGGMMSLGPVFDQRRHWDWLIYRSIYNRIKQFWTREKWVRVTDDDNAPRFIGLNVPRTMLEFWEAQLLDQGLPPEEVAQKVQEASQDPRANLPAPPANPVAEMDVDIKIEDAPDITTIQQEQFTEILQLASSGFVQFTAEEIIQMAPGLRNKKKLLENRRRAQEAQQGEQEQLKQVALDRERREGQKDDSVTFKNAADGANKLADAEKKKAETQEILRGDSGAE